MTVSGRWATGENGGCPKSDSWPQNPQYRLLPGGEAGSEASFHIALTCDDPALAVGFVLLEASPRDGGGRRASPKLRKSEIIHKTTWRAAPSESTAITVDVTLKSSASGYLLIPSTFAPGPKATFQLHVTGGADFTFEPIGHSATTLAEPLGAVPTMPIAPVVRPRPAAAEPAPVVEEGMPTIESEGQGLSAKQLSDTEALVSAALAQCASTGRKFEDPAFTPTKASLWINGSAPAPELGLSTDPVVAWRRPEEWDPAASLFLNEWEIAGVVAGPLPNLWLLSACNIVAADHDVIERVFINAEHASSGLYVVRFFVDDPTSDDDWVVVCVDDRLPCGFDARPCFARSPSPKVLWVSIIEKALAKWRGSYEATVTVPKSISPP